jgi:hypothetical protein
MRHADLVGFLFRLLPFVAWKDALLHGHIENCPACLGRLASREEARSVLIHSEEVGIPGGFWPAIVERISGCETITAPGPSAGAARAPELAPGPRRWAWRWAAAVSGTALAVVLTIALVSYLRAPAPAPGIAAVGAAESVESASDQVRIHYVRIDNAPAQTFIFKPHDSDVVIVWAGKNI